MPLLTKLDFIPSSNYRNVAPDGASNESQGIEGVPWHNEPHFVVGVSSRAGTKSQEIEFRLDGVSPYRQ